MQDSYSPIKHSQRASVTPFYAARDFVGRERFGLLIPDQLFVGHASLTQLTNRGYPANAAISSLVRIPPDELSYFSNARSFRYDTMKGESNVVLITGIEQAQCDPRSGLLRGFGRTIYPPHVFQFLGREFANPVTREVDLFRTFQALLTEVPNYGVFLEGEPSTSARFPDTTISGRECRHQALSPRYMPRSDASKREQPASHGYSQA